MSKPPPKEVGPTTAIVALVIVIAAIFFTYSFLSRPKPSHEPEPAAVIDPALPAP